MERVETYNKVNKSFIFQLNIFILFCELVLSYLINKEILVIFFICHLSLLMIMEKDMTNVFILLLSFISFNQIIVIDNRGFNIYAIAFFIFFIRSIINLYNTKNNEEKRKIHIIFALIVLFMIYYCLSMILTGDISVSYLFILLTVVSIILGVMQINRVDVIKIYHYYIVMFILSLFLGGVAKYIPELSDLIRNATVGGVKRFTGLAWDTNFLALQCCCNVGMLISLIEQRKKDRLFHSICLLIVFVAGLLTVSKMYIFGLGVMFIVWLFASKTKFEIKTLLLVTLVVGVITLYLIMPEDSSTKVLIQRFINIFTEKQGLNSITTGRWNIWVAYLADWTSSAWKMFFGSGVFYTSPYEGRAVHNLYIELLYEFGLLGVILLIGTFIIGLLFGLKKLNFYNKYCDRKAMKSKKQERKRKRINYLALTAVLICYFALSAFTETNSLSMLMIVCLILNVDKETISNEI